MLFRKELYFNILLSISLGKSFAEEIFNASFTATVTRKSVTTDCNFTISFTDTEIRGNSKVKCDKISKFMLIPSFKYELKKTMHILRRAFKKKHQISVIIFKFFLLFWAFFVPWNFLKASFSLRLKIPKSGRASIFIKDSTVEKSSISSFQI